jgi:hypothetical protein
LRGELQHVLKAAGASNKTSFGWRMVAEDLLDRINRVRQELPPVGLSIQVSAGSLSEA